MPGNKEPNSIKVLFAKAYFKRDSYRVQTPKLRSYSSQAVWRGEIQKMPKPDLGAYLICKNNTNFSEDQGISAVTLDFSFHSRYQHRFSMKYWVELNFKL